MENLQIPWYPGNGLAGQKLEKCRLANAVASNQAILMPIDLRRRDQECHFGVMRCRPTFVPSIHTVQHRPVSETRPVRWGGRPSRWKSLESGYPRRASRQTARLRPERCTVLQKSNEMRQKLKAPSLVFRKLRAWLPNGLTYGSPLVSWSCPPGWHCAQAPPSVRA